MVKDIPTKCITLNTDEQQSKQSCEDTHGQVKNVYLNKGDIVIEFNDKSVIRHNLVHVDSIVIEINGKEQRIEPQKIKTEAEVIKKVKKEATKKPSQYWERSKERAKQNALKSFFRGLFRIG